ncbi:hypothetical protein [Vibrio cholerae]|uniref:hypothetical protein n=1 Tax=Vibrio cholerae TaxID=666 RepID=UPI0039C9A9EC
MRIVWWDGSGVCLYSKTLEDRSRFMKSTPAKPVSASSTAFRACRPSMTATPWR